MRNRNVLLKGYRNAYAKNVVVIEYFTAVTTWRQAISTTKLIRSPFFHLPDVSFKVGGKEQVYVAFPGTHVQSIAPIDRRESVLLRPARAIGTANSVQSRRFHSTQINRHGARDSGRRGLPTVTILGNLQEEPNGNSQQDPECATRPTRVPGHGTENREIGKPQGV